MKRLINTVVLVIFVIILNWFIFQAMPGEIAAIGGLQGKYGANLGDIYQRLNARYGLDKPPLERFLNYFWAMLTFNFGTSYNSNNAVTQDMIGSGKLYNTLLLLGSSTVLSIIVGVMAGVIAAHKRGKTFDSASVTASLTTFSLPTFWMGIILILVFYGTLQWLPGGNVIPFAWTQPGAQLPSLPVQILVRFEHLLLPMLTLTIFTYGGFLLLTRASMLETLSEDYIVTARAKGLKTRTVLFKHALKNASLPIVTASALAFGGILGGAIITETIFNWDGLGLWLFNAITSKDLPVMQAMFYILALGVIIANLISDLIYGVIDPRIKYQ